MHLDAIDLYRFPLVNEQSESSCPIESVMAVLKSGEHVGFGLVSLATAPLVSAEWSAGAFACLRDWLAPAVVGRSVSSGEYLQELLAPFHGNAGAKSALDIAWWSLAATIEGKPLWRLLGGSQPIVRLSATLGVMPSTDALFAEIEKCLALGHDPIVLKYRPGWDVEMLRAVRQAFPGAPLAIDCDGLCSLAQQETFYRVQDFSLRWIEQPFASDDLVGHAMLAQNLRTPLMLDQSVTSLERSEQMIDLQSCQSVRIDPARVGGLTPALAIMRACRQAGLQVAIGGGPQGAIAGSAAAALAAMADLPLDTSALRLINDPWAGGDQTVWLELEASRAVLRLPEEIPGGLSILPDTEMVGDCAIERATLR
jgi:O-succinylbenzoate synthase